MEASIAQYLERVLNPEKSDDFEVLTDGTLTSDGTEQILLEYRGSGKISGYIDLSEMRSGDTVLIREYICIRLRGDYKLYHEEEYKDFQHPSILYIDRKESHYGVRLTLQQTQGNFRKFPYLFIREY